MVCGKARRDERWARGEKKRGSRRKAKQKGSLFFFSRHLGEMKTHFAPFVTQREVNTLHNVANNVINIMCYKCVHELARFKGNKGYKLMLNPCMHHQNGSLQIKRCFFASKCAVTTYQHEHGVVILHSSMWCRSISMNNVGLWSAMSWMGCSGLDKMHHEACKKRQKHVMVCYFLSHNDAKCGDRWYTMGIIVWKWELKREKESNPPPHTQKKKTIDKH